MLILSSVDRVYAGSDIKMLNKQLVAQDLRGTSGVLIDDVRIEM